MVYTVTDVTIVDKKNGIFTITVSDGVREVTVRANRKELESNEGKKRIKMRMVDKFKKDNDIKNEEGNIKTTVEEMLVSQIR